MAKVKSLSPKRKAQKFAKELKTGKCFTNAGVKKKDKHGKHKTLTKKQRSYRAGYLDARKDIGVANKLRKNKTPTHDYSNFFDFNEKGRIKGSYVDGIFEPD